MAGLGQIDLCDELQIYNCMCNYKSPACKPGVTKVKRVLHRRGLRRMRRAVRGGVIVNLLSILSAATQPMTATYSPAKEAASFPMRIGPVSR
jgi:hypothetical protein